MGPIGELETIEAEEDDIVDDVGEAADFTEKEVEARELSDDEDGGNDDSEEDEEDSFNPAIGGFEFIMDVCSTCCALFFIFANVVIVHDNVKFEEMFVEADDVCDKSVGSVMKNKQHTFRIS